MDRDQLRAAQAPLKQRYREEPSAALVTLRARGTLGDGVSCSTQTGPALAAPRIHPAPPHDVSPRHARPKQLTAQAQSPRLPAPRKEDALHTPYATPSPRVP